MSDIRIASTAFLFNLEKCDVALLVTIDRVDNKVGHLRREAHSRRSLLRFSMLAVIETAPGLGCEVGLQRDFFLLEKSPLGKRPVADHFNHRYD
jgi:hypothetical protein